MDQRPYLHEANIRGLVSIKGWLSMLRLALRKIAIALFAFWLLLGTLYFLQLRRDGFPASLNVLMAISFMGIVSGLASLLQTRSLVFEKERIIVSGVGRAEKTMRFKNMTQCLSIEINDNLEKWQFNSTQEPTIEFFVAKNNRSRKRCLTHLHEHGINFKFANDADERTPAEA